MLENELNRILGSPATAATTGAPRVGKRKTMSAEARARFSAAMKKSWAKKWPTTTGQQPKSKAKMSPAAKSNLSAKMKEIWAK